MTILLRGPIFRTLVSYEPINSRRATTTAHFHRSTGLFRPTIQKTSTSIDTDAAIDEALELTSSSLRFTFSRTPEDPRMIAREGRANCVGYTAMFNRFLMTIAERDGLELTVEHAVARLRFLGLDIHSPLSAVLSGMGLARKSFFKDHDFSLVTDQQSGETVAVDAALYDYLGIDRVRSRVFGN